MSDRLVNRLAESRSLYLRDAARSPAAWQPWGAAAFALARALDRPLLLDIGASWCHWCHVMDEESYENAEIAAILNAEFVPVKVDRDERPDVDARYQAAVGAITGSGGWPLTAFLTPSGDVFYGGTYFPPDDRPGMPGLKSLLPRIAQTYQRNRDQVERSAAELLAALRARQATPAGAADAGAVRECVDGVIAALRAEFDETHAGFGDEPKFLHPAAIELAYAAGWLRGDATLTAMATRTLATACRSGLIDHLGGGFHRYTVDRAWRLPHFEKLLADQAEALRVLAMSDEFTAPPANRAAATGIVAYLLRQAPAEERAWFAAAQDADGAGGDEGDYYTWTEREVEAALSAADALLAKRRFGIGPRGDVRHDPRRNVLLPAEEADAASPGAVDHVRDALLRARAARPAPRIDHTCLTGANAQMASALFAAGVRFADPALTARARRLVDFLRDVAFSDDGLVAHVSDARRPRGDAAVLLDDQLGVAMALLDGYEHLGDAAYLREACALLDATLRGFAEPGAACGSGGLRDRLADDGGDGLGAMPWRIVLDHAGAGGNAVAILALDRAATLAGRADFAEAAARIVETFAAGVAGQGRFAATFALALQRRAAAPLHIVVVGEAGDAGAAELHRCALSIYHPARSVCRVTPSHGAAAPEIARAAVAGHRPGSPAAAYVCQGDSCSLPCATPQRCTPAFAPRAPEGDTNSAGPSLERDRPALRVVE